jgi:HPt (histidine-containing phosphotransfer) domain-containing protein
MEKKKNTENVIDLEYIRTFSDGDEDFVREMVELFSEKIPAEVKELNVAVTEKNWERAYKATHDLKSSTSFVGMEYLRKDVLELERCTKFTQDLELVPALVEQISKECGKAAQELKEAIGSL